MKIFNSPVDCSHSGDFSAGKGQEEQKEQKVQKEAKATLLTAQRSAETRQTPREEDDLEEEELSFTYVENVEEHKMSDKVGFSPLLLISPESVPSPNTLTGVFCQMVDLSFGREGV